MVNDTSVQQQICIEKHKKCEEQCFLLDPSQSYIMRTNRTSQPISLWNSDYGVRSWETEALVVAADCSPWRRGARWSNPTAVELSR